MRRSRIIRRLAGWILIPPLVLTALLFGYFVYPVLFDPEPDFIQTKGQLISVQTTREWQRDDARFSELTLQSNSGLQVEISIRRPLDAKQPLPLVLLLGGYGTGRHATELIKQPYNIIIASLNYPYKGDRRMQGIGLLKNIRHIQTAMRDITPAILLTLDYLLQQDDIDKQHVEMVGVSLVAFFAAIPAAMDERIHRLWLVQGAGNPRAIFDYRLKAGIESPWMRRQVAGLISLLGNVHHLTPERWVSRIPPRQVIVINSHSDPTYPPQAVSDLHEALRQPYKIIWQDGGHVKPSAAGIVKQLSDIVLSEIETRAK